MDNCSKLYIYFNIMEIALTGLKVYTFIHIHILKCVHTFILVLKDLQCVVILVNELGTF